MRSGSRARAGLVASAVLAILAGCSPFGGVLTKEGTAPDFLIQHVPGEGTVPYSVDLGTGPHSVFFAFTNPSSQVSAPALPAVSGGNGSRSVRPLTPVTALASTVAPTPDRVMRFNQDPFRQGPFQRVGSRQIPTATHPRRDPTLPEGPDQVGEESNSWFDVGADNTVYGVPSTCRYVSPQPVDTASGQRSLSIWVANDCWDGLKSRTVTQPMVDALASRFLTPGPSNDIYDWVCGMLGEEWGPHDGQDLIPPDQRITILLLDIQNDDSTQGGVIGYYWAKDNFRDSSVYDPDPTSPSYFPVHSHQRIMFYVDAVMYANAEGGSWSPEGHWPCQVFSALAHELQHMVNFYQKTVRHGLRRGCDPWINEMTSQCVEDLVADKLGTAGPRGVNPQDGSSGPGGNTSGRIPVFNADPMVSLSDWGAASSPASYAATYAFGAYLVRNYGGAALLRAMVQSPQTDSTQILDAVRSVTGRSETLSSLLSKWGIAVLLSDRTDAPVGYQYNVGGFFGSSVDGLSYRAGSMDFYKYQQAGSTGGEGPALYSGMGLVGERIPGPTSETLFEACKDSGGAVSWTIDVPKGMELTVLVR
ncbi:MAG TPA: peptidase M30 [Spirochaetia bacterium]|nr:peptidase M30 [Spirochaetia bacterium]